MTVADQESRERARALPAGLPENGYVRVREYAALKEAYSCPYLSAALSGPGEELFHEGTVMRLDGDVHKRRRRALSLLLRKRGHAYFRNTALIPYSQQALDEVLAHPDPDGYARVDLVKWIRRVNFQLAAALVGYDDATTPEGAQRLFELLEITLKARPSAVQIVMGGFDLEHENVRLGLQARAQIKELYYDRAIARRKALVEKVRAGEMDEDDLPQDFLTLVALEADPDYADPGIAERETLFVLGAGVHTTAMYTIITLRELFEYFAEHPEARAQVTNDDFVLGAANEGLRLNPLPLFLRKAVADIDLVDGTHITDGELVGLEPFDANRDPDVWGQDAEDFNPYRELPKGGPRGYGFSFGAGTHMCFGLPLVMGAEGVDGSLVHLVRLLLKAGIEPDLPEGELLKDVRVNTVGKGGRGFPVKFKVA